MYSPAIVNRRLNSLADYIRKTSDAKFEFKDYSIAEVASRSADLERIYDRESGTLTQPLSAEAESWILHEISRSKVDFRYWLTRYALIKNKEATLVRVVPTHVQDLLLKRIGQAEFEAINGTTGDGVLFAVLKARQLGVSTISECIISHRVFFYSNIASIIAADVDDHTANLYEMAGRLLDNLPWWMTPRSLDPKRDYRAKNKLIAFADQDSLIRFSSGKNMQGGQDQEKGSIGTGQTLHLFHISEFALWPNAEQIYDSLLPAVPMSSRAFGIIESTAKGRGNEWHNTWERAKKGLGRLKPVFFPYYTDPRDYSLPVPPGWKPSADTILHAERVHETSAQWVGTAVTLTPGQMYWYEKRYAEYQDARNLNKFFAEYAADDLEAFQSSTLSVFPTELISQMRKQSYHQPIYVDIRPRSEKKLSGG